MTPVDGPLRRISNFILSSANSASFHCFVNFSNEMGGVIVAFSKNASRCRIEFFLFQLLTVPC